MSTFRNEDWPDELERVTAQRDELAEALEGERRVTAFRGLVIAEFEAQRDELAAALLKHHKYQQELQAAGYGAYLITTLCDETEAALAKVPHD